MAQTIYLQKEIDSPLQMQHQNKNNEEMMEVCDHCINKHQLGPDICGYLPGFQAFSGCDTISGFNGNYKKGIFKLVSSNEHFREAKKLLGDDLDENDELESSCEAAICKLFGSNYTDVN